VTVPLANRPQFSVLVPVFNHERFIVDALESLRKQTIDSWEAIIVDDGSTDSTPSILDSYVDRDHRFRVIHKANGGVGSALNRGLGEATCDWICWLSSDDLFEPAKLHLHRKLISGDPACLFHVTHFRDLDDATGVLVATPLDSRFPTENVQVLSLFRSNFIHGNSICINRAAWLEIGGFDESLRWGQDYDMWLRLLARYPARFIRNRTCITRLHPSQGSVQSPRAILYDASRAAIRFLAERPLDQILPGLGHEEPRSVRAMLRYAFRVAADPGACMYATGPHPLLILRILEWSRSPQGERHRDFVRGQLQHWAKRVECLSPDSRLSLLWRTTAAAPESALDRIAIEQASPFSLAQQTLRRLQISEPREAVRMAQYLASCGQDVSQDVPAPSSFAGQYAAVDPGFFEKDTSALAGRNTLDMISAARSGHLECDTIAVSMGAEGLRWADDTLSLWLPGKDQLDAFLQRLGCSASTAEGPGLATNGQNVGMLVQIPQPSVGLVTRVGATYARTEAAATHVGLIALRRARYLFGALRQTRVRSWPGLLKSIWGQHRRTHSSN
jgi:hypothetical protein